MSSIWAFGIKGSRSEWQGGNLGEKVVARRLSEEEEPAVATSDKNCMAS